MQGWEPRRHSEDCLIGMCQDDAKKAARVPMITDWFGNCDKDVVVFQEAFSFDQELKRGMIAAGFCHYVTTTKGTRGSGLAIYSKSPIVYTNFVDWFDTFGPGEPASTVDE
jgi:exonuclease III